jgi:hypothetical protein
MDDLLTMFGLGRALALTVAIGASVAALFTAPVDAKGSPLAAAHSETQPLPLAEPVGRMAR